MLRAALLLACASVVPPTAVKGQRWAEILTAPYFPTSSSPGISLLTDVDYSSSLIAYEVPEYTAALDNYTHFINDIRRKMPSLDLDFSDSLQHPSVVVLLGVVEGLINAMAVRERSNYIAVFDAVMPKLFNASVDNRSVVAKRLRCVINNAKNKIQRLENIINNPNVAHICFNAPPFCDHAIQAIIEEINDDKLFKKADLLISLGRFGGLYESEYKSTFDRISQYNKQSLRRYLLDQKADFKELVKIGAEVRRKINEFHINDCPTLPSHGKKQLKSYIRKI